MKKIAIAVLMSAVMAPAIAEMGDMDKHMYVGLRAGPANTNIDNIIFGNNTNNASGNPTGWGIFVGHIVNPNFSVEAEYLNLGQIKSNTNTKNSTGLDVSLLGGYPFNDQFSLFGKLGYAMITGKPGGTCSGCTDTKDRGLTYGFGGQFNVTPVVGIRLGWDKYRFNDNGTNGHANFYSIGGLVKF
jgi:OOP family OmpA-OmpF porin